MTGCAAAIGIAEAAKAKKMSHGKLFYSSERSAKSAEAAKTLCQGFYSAMRRQGGESAGEAHVHNVSLPFAVDYFVTYIKDIRVYRGLYRRGRQSGNAENGPAAPMDSTRRGGGQWRTE